jgi:hypothetical protein
MAMFTCQGAPASFQSACHMSTILYIVSVLFSIQAALYPDLCSTTTADPAAGSSMTRSGSASRTSGGPAPAALSGSPGLCCPACDCPACDCPACSCPALSATQLCSEHAQRTRQLWQTASPACSRCSPTGSRRTRQLRRQWRPVGRACAGAGCY